MTGIKHGKQTGVRSGQRYEKHKTLKKHRLDLDNDMRGIKHEKKIQRLDLDNDMKGIS